MVLDKNFCRGHANFFRDEAEMREIYQEIHGTSEGVVFEFIGIGG